MPTPLMPPSVRLKSATTMVGRISGTVIWRTVCQPLAPSMRLLSITSFETVCSAASSSSVMKGSARQVAARIR